MRTTNILLLLALALATTASASASNTPEAALEETIHEMVDVLHLDDTTTSLEAKRENVLRILERSFSFDIIIRRSLGRNWNRLDPKQQDSVTILVTDLLIRAYTRELQNGPKPKITFLRTETLAPNKKIEVPTEVTYKGTEVAISYRLANIKNRGWQVYDVLIEGISMVSNYRKQFDKHFQTRSANDLIALLKNKLKNFDS